MFLSDFYLYTFNFDKALELLEISIKLSEKDNFTLYHCYFLKAHVYFLKNNIRKCDLNIEESLKIQTKMGHKSYEYFRSIIINQLVRKKMGKKLNLKEIKFLVKKRKDLEYDQSYLLYILLDDISYLKISYKTIMSMSKNLKEGTNEFLKNPYTLKITNEYNKVFSN
tara:strand:- start:161 stop:661 length:501 start_codon:yes stop_codon:yes gene_type:complete